MPSKELWEAYGNLTVRQSVRPSSFMSGAYKNPKFGVWMHLRMAECQVPFSGHCDLEI